MQLTDDMVRVAAEALVKRHFGRHAKFANTSARYQTQFLYDARAALTAALAAMWRPIEEAEPNQTYLLGWRDWRDDRWCMEVGAAVHGQRLENGYSNVSQHGSATHFMPIPQPPKVEG